MIIPTITIMKQLIGLEHILDLLTLTNDINH